MGSRDNSGSNSGIASWIESIDKSRVLLLSERNITVGPYLKGEDYFMNKLLGHLRAGGILADVFYLSKGVKGGYYSGETGKLEKLESLVGKYDLIILHCISPLRLLRAKTKYGVKLGMPVFFLWNNASSLLFNLKGVIGNTFWQPIINEYIVTSSEIERGLRARGVFKKINLISPTYDCKYCNVVENGKKLANLKRQLPKSVRAVYIGSLNVNRFSVDGAVKKLQSFGDCECNLDIYTESSIEEETFTVGNVTVNIKSKILSDEEKCKVLRGAHLFIAPKRHTTMDPPLSVMEASFHGNIVIEI